jgi:hypothetical protein
MEEDVFQAKKSQTLALSELINSSQYVIWSMRTIALQATLVAWLCCKVSATNSKEISLWDALELEIRPTDKKEKGTNVNDKMGKDRPTDKKEKATNVNRPTDKEQKATDVSDEAKDTAMTGEDGADTKELDFQMNGGGWLLEGDRWCKSAETNHEGDISECNEWPIKSMSCDPDRSKKSVSNSIECESSKSCKSKSKQLNQNANQHVNQFLCDEIRKWDSVSGPQSFSHATCSENLNDKPVIPCQRALHRYKFKVHESSNPSNSVQSELDPVLCSLELQCIAIDRGYPLEIIEQFNSFVGKNPWVLQCPMEANENEHIVSMFVQFLDHFATSFVSSSQFHGPLSVHPSMEKKKGFHIPKSTKFTD